MVDFNAGIRYIEPVVAGGDKAALFADQLSVFAPNGPFLVPHGRGATLDRKMANASTVTFDPRTLFRILGWRRDVVFLAGYPVTGFADSSEAGRMLTSVEIVGSDTDP